MSSTNQPIPPAASTVPVPPVDGSIRLPGGVHEVLVLAYPVILTQITMTAMGIVDSAMVGSLGATELGAVGFGGIWLWAIVCFFVGSTSVSPRAHRGSSRVTNYLRSSSGAAASSTQRRFR